MLSLRLIVCKLVRPEKKSEGMEVKLLVSRKTCWREERFAKVGKGPERELRWREMDWRLESWLRVEGREPERDLEGRLMAVTRLEVSHLMPDQLQGFAPVQSEGEVERVVANLVITAASSAEVRVRREREMKRVERGRRREFWDSIVGFLGSSVVEKI